MPFPDVPKSPFEIAKVVGVTRRQPEYWFPSLCDELIRLRSDRLKAIRDRYIRIVVDELHPGMQAGLFKSEMDGAKQLARRYGISEERLRRQARYVRVRKHYPGRRIGRTTRITP